MYYCEQQNELFEQFLDRRFTFCSYFSVVSQNVFMLLSNSLSFVKFYYQNVHMFVFMKMFIKISSVILYHFFLEEKKKKKEKREDFDRLGYMC